MTAQRPAISLYGFLAGLISGLVLAVAIALYLTNSPVPFVSKVQRASENITPDAGDPNRPLFSPQIPAAPGADSAAHSDVVVPAAPPGGTATPAPAAAPAAGAARAAGTAPAATTAATPAAPGSAGAGAPAAAADGATEAAGTARLMLQVGAFKNADDADVLRARIALLGLDAKVTSSDVDGAPLYRVRLGPYGALDDLDGIRRTLSENGMEPQLVHVK